VLPCGR